MLSAQHRHRNCDWQNKFRCRVEDLFSEGESIESRSITTMAGGIPSNCSRLSLAKVRGRLIG
jgi:hypothetical protein